MHKIHMYKKYCATVIIMFAASAPMVFAFGAKESSSGKKVVNVYSHRHYDVDAEIYKAFTEDTGIEVNVISGGAGELVERAIAEKESTQADIFFVVGANIVAQLKDKGVLQAIPASILRGIPKNIRDNDNLWSAVSKRARVIVYDKQTNPNPSVTSYEDLVKGNHTIAIRSSENSYNRMLLASIVHAEGEKYARQWVKNLVAHLARPPQGNDRSQAKAVIAGIADYAVMNTYYAGLMIRSTDAEERKVGERVGIIFPNQNSRGTHVNISAVALAKYAKHKENAVKLIRFLLSKEAQRMIAEQNFEYPALSSVNPAELVSSWGDFKADKADLNKVGLLVPVAAKIADEEGWK